jgi:hypothetical protein
MRSLSNHGKRSPFDKLRVTLPFLRLIANEAHGIIMSGKSRRAKTENRNFYPLARIGKIGDTDRKIKPIPWISAVTALDCDSMWPSY